MKRIPIALSFAIIGLTGQAMAMEMDMSKLTCKEVAAMPPARTVAVAMWMSGYAHGKAGNAMIDGDKAETNAEKIAAYCKKNPTATVASAVKAMGKM